MLKYLLEKEFKQIMRNKFIPKMIIAMPLFMMLIMPWAANQEVTNIRLTVVDNDRSVISDELVRKVVSSGYFIFQSVSDGSEEALRDVDAGKADIILDIPDGFEKDLQTERVAGVMISSNSVNGTKGILGSSYLSTIVNDFATSLSEEMMMSQPVVTSSVGKSFRIMPQYKFNPHLDYKVFMVPAIMVMLLTMITGFLPAFNIVGEKEAGTIEQINVTPASRMQFILAKLIPYWCIGLIVFTLCMLLAVFVYSLIPVGSLLTIYLFAVVYIVAVSGMGLVVSNYSDTMQQAMFVMFFFIMIFLLMSGLLTPVASMPDWAQYITIFNPLKYFISVMRMVYLKGSGFAELVPYFLSLCGFAVVFNAWAILGYRKRS